MTTPIEKAGAAILILLAVVALLAINLALAAFGAWVGIEAVAGIDVSFREAVGAGILLTLAQGSSGAVTANRS